MYVSLIKPQKIEPIELDQFLEKGWFRLGDNLFTTSFLAFQENLFNALWIRVHLPSFTVSKSQASLLNKTAKFRVEVSKMVLTYEKCNLFLKYRGSLEFEPARQLEHILMAGNDLFDTYNVCIYDQNRLIACGIFDTGLLGVEGIVSFFDPNYKKYSLGKLLVLHKLQYCRANGFQWFYPGYIVPGHKRFNYKLDISKNFTEYYDTSLDEWKNILSLDLTTQPLDVMFRALQTLESVLRNFDYQKFSLKKYRFFDIGLDSGYASHNLLSYPYFIHCFANSQLEEVVIVYNTFSHKYELLICHKVFQVNMPHDSDYFSEFLIKPIKIVFTEANPLNFAFGLQRIFKRNSRADVKEK